VAHLDSGLEGGRKPGLCSPAVRCQRADAGPGVEHWTPVRLADRFRAHAGNTQHLYGYAMAALPTTGASGPAASSVATSTPRGA
jgi:hypothetical protein